ncbi:NAD-dependent epimerase/dehydratase family protein [Massilia arenae]|uniref:NAD-dependent epimerase/dehydratase family protein n=1 Tax=Massilia arenae TaxID=2603288 RepID=UPI001E4A9118|nr:NAD-dependent epimerase/dehydratase family protein [Massilia arenae]
MRILLTGASGFIGQHLLQALLTEGHHVVCALRAAEAKLPKSDDPRLSVQYRAIMFLAVAGLCSVQKLCWAN